MSWMNQWISGDGEQPVGPLAPNAVKQRKPTKLQSTTPPLDSPIVDAEETPPGSPYGNFPMDDKYPRVADPAKLSEGRTVSTKPSNRPFLAHKNYREQLEQEHLAWEKRMKEREEKIKRGEKVGPAEPDPREETEVGVVGLLKFFLTLAIFALLAGKFFTGSYLWNYEPGNMDLSSYWPDQGTLFTERSLAKFDGTDAGRPIYLAIDGEVYDVSSNRRVYGKGGGYGHFTGKDAARAYGTGCFQEHATHDLRGLTEQQLAGVEHWKQFFKNSKKYKRVGRVMHPPIDPNSPIPPMCEPPKPVDPAPAKAAPQPQPEARKHEEL